MECLNNKCDNFDLAAKNHCGKKGVRTWNCNNAESRHTASGVRLDKIVSHFCEVFSVIQDNFENEHQYWRIMDIVDKPQGQKQGCDSDFFDYEYVDQQEDGCGDYGGYVYLPVGNKFLKIEYSG